MGTVVLALGAAALWGTGDFFGGLAARRAAVLTVLFWSQLAGLVGLVIWTAASGSARPGAGLLFAAGAGVAGAVGLGCLYRGLAVGAMGIVAPISAASPIVPLVVDLTRGRSPAPVQWVGIVFAIAGIVLVSRDPGRSGRVAAGVGLALTAALGFGLFIVGLGEAAQESAPWATTTARFSSLAAVLLALAWTRSVPRVSRRLLPLIVCVGAFDAGANVLIALASTRGSIGIVAVLSSLYPLTTILLARGDPARATRPCPHGRWGHGSRGSRPDRRRLTALAVPRGGRDVATGASRSSDVEADVEHVAVLHDVRLALEPLRPSLRGLGVQPASRRSFQRITSQRMNPRAMSEWIVPPALERGLAVAERPRACLLLTGREERDQAESVLEPPHDLVERRGTFAEGRRFLVDSSASSASSLQSIPSGPLTLRSAAWWSADRARPAGRRSSRSAAARIEVCQNRTEDLLLPPNACVAGFRLLRDPLEPLRDMIRVGDQELELELLEIAVGTPLPENPSATARSASTCRNPPRSAGPVPGTSCTRTAAGVTFFAPTSSARSARRSSAIVAMPTFDLSVWDAYAVISAPAFVRR